MIEVFVGVGANLGKPVEQVLAACDQLSSLLNDFVCSSLYQTKAWGYENQADFINCVAKGCTHLSAFELLEALQGIEKDQGRQRHACQWGPRSIDLDLLLYGDRSFQHETLIVPHPRMKSRAFVLCPLAEIAPNLMLPCGSLICDLIRLPAIQTQGVREFNIETVQ